MATTLNMTLLLRRGEFSNSYVLQEGEPGFHTGTHVLKIGQKDSNGQLMTWEALPFANEDQIKELIKVVDDKVAALGDTYATDEEVRVIKEALEASIKTINDTLATYGDIVTHDAAEFEIAGAAAAVAGDLADYENTNDARVKAIEDEIDAFGDIVTHNVAEFATAEQGTKADNAAVKADVDAAFEAVNEEVADVREIAEAATTVDEVNGQIDAKINALNLGTTYEPIGAEDRAKAYVDGKFAEANLGQYTTEQEVKDIVDGVIAGAADSETYNSLTKLVDYIDTHGGEATEMASAIDVLEGKVETIEGKPAYEITSTQVSNWDGEVGAKALAQGIKDVVDANKETWDKAGTALQAADLADYAKSAAVTEEIAEAIAGEVTRTEGAYSKLDHKHVVADITDYAADVASKIEAYGYATDENAQKYATDAQAAAEGTAASALAAARTEITAEISAAVNPVEARVKAIEDAPYATEGFVTAAVAGKDVGVTRVTAGTDIVVTPGENGAVEVAHKDYATGTVTKDPADAEVPHFITGINIENGHVTSATVQSLASALQSMEFILDCGSAE